MRNARKSWQARLLLRSLPSWRSWALSIFFLLVLVPTARAQQVVLPLTLDNRLLTALIIKDTFTGKNHSAAIVGNPGECMYIGLSDPKITSAGNFLRLEMRLSIRLGTQLGTECLVPLEWQGYITLVQQPVFDNQTLSLTFRTIDSNLYNLNRQPASIASALWDFAKPRVLERLGMIRINLAPPIRDMRDFLGPLFREKDRQKMQAMLDSLRGGTTTVEKDGVIVQLTAEVEEVFSPEEKPESAELTPEEHRWLIRLWETWDALLVQLITTIAVGPLTPEDQQLLIDVLLDTRHAFVATLDQNDMTRDFVREQFVQAWHDLGPIFRRQLFARSDNNNTLGYLAFFTAADALAVFDRMGPTFGIEVSEQGLLRLATMLTGGETPLPYSLQIDERLRKLMQLPAPAPKNGGDDTIIEEDLEEIDLPVEKEHDPFSQVANFFFAPVYAAESQPYGQILEWRVPKENIGEYVGRVRTVVNEATSGIIARQQIPDQLGAIFQRMVMATAWQESCFRQFIEKGSKLSYLMSYNNTSVGVMQVNERVWRGMYDLRKLRWDIRYNAQAGSEIVDLYLRRHALDDKAPASGMDLDLLAKGVYAMYNGGPGQYKKFLERARAGKPYPTDRAYAEKLKWVTTQDWEKIEECLGGD